MKILALLALFALTFVGGCRTIAEIPDEEFANGIHTISYNATYYGFKAVLNNNPGRYAQLTADAKTTSDIIRNNVLPVFTSTTGEVLVGAVDLALSQLSVSSTVTDVVKVALSLVQLQVKLPDNPAAALDVRTKLALVGFFSGLAEGLDKAVADTPAPSPAPNEGAAKTVTAPTAPDVKLKWTK